MNKLRILFGVILLFLITISGFYLGLQYFNRIKKQKNTEPIKDKIDTSCSKDLDCKLINRKYFPDCCFINGCDPLDYSEERWIAVNSKWEKEQFQRKCAQEGEPRSCPLCYSMPKNENYKAVCQNNICVKIDLYQTSISQPKPLSNLKYQIPENWQFYDKEFQGYHFRFSFPQGYFIDDWDEDSGNISVRNQAGDIVYLELERFNSYRGINYTGGIFTDWISVELKDYDENLPIEKISFVPVNFSNGNIFYRVYTRSSETLAFFSKENDYYFGIFNNKVVLIIDDKKLDGDDVYRILQSLKVE